MPTKTCSRCRAEKPIDEFYRCAARKDGLKSACKACTRTDEKTWPSYSRRLVEQEKSRRTRGVRPRAVGRDPQKRRENISKSMKKQYGITLDEYDEMLATQDGRCAICECQIDANKRFAVDHDHQTGAVRGLLCQKCNTGLGLLGDDCSSLSMAWSYLFRAELQPTKVA